MPASRPGSDSTTPQRPSSSKATFDLTGIPLDPPQAPDEIGRIGAFRILRKIGQGGMGAVYAAEDTQLNRSIAIKVMLPAVADSPQARARFLREARSVAAVRHEHASDHIVHIYQVGEHRGVPYIVMPLLKGETLDRYLMRTGIPPVAETWRIAREIVEGLVEAHSAGLIHRDIKPSNIWLEGDRRHVVLLDFGLARSLDDAAITNPGEPLGTPAYMAPEQARGQPLDARCDLFSVGAVLFEMLTGRRAFAGDSRHQVLIALIESTPPPVEQCNPIAPPAMCKLTAELLAKNRDDRPKSAREVLLMLDAARPEGAAIPSYSPSVRTTAPLSAVGGKGTNTGGSRKRIAIALIVAVMLAAALYPLRLGFQLLIVSGLLLGLNQFVRSRGWVGERLLMMVALLFADLMLGAAAIAGIVLLFQTPIQVWKAPKTADGVVVSMPTLPQVLSKETASSALAPWLCRLTVEIDASTGHVENSPSGVLLATDGKKGLIATTRRSLSADAKGDERWPSVKTWPAEMSSASFHLERKGEKPVDAILAAICKEHKVAFLLADWTTPAPSAIPVVRPGRVQLKSKLFVGRLAPSGAEVFLEGETAPAGKSKTPLITIDADEAGGGPVFLSLHGFLLGLQTRNETPAKGSTEEQESRVEPLETAIRSLAKDGESEARKWLIRPELKAQIHELAKLVPIAE